MDGKIEQNSVKQINFEKIIKHEENDDIANNILQISS